MRWIIFINGDMMQIAEQSSHLNVVFEDVDQEKLLELLAMDQSVWDDFVIRRTTDSGTADFHYERHTLDHVEFRNKDLCFKLREVSQAELNQQALGILLGGVE